MKENLCIGGKKGADETKEYALPIETGSEMTLPPEVLEALKLKEGDIIAFILEDDGEVYLRKA